MYKEEKESLNQLKFPGIKTENIHLKKVCPEMFYAENRHTLHNI